MTLQDLGVLVSLLVLACGTYLVWPSRWNLPAHFAAALWFVSAFVPVGILGILHGYPTELVNSYSRLLALGAAGFVIGLAIGALLAVSRRDSRHPDEVVTAPLIASSESSARRTVFVTVLCFVLLAYSFARMGFIPIFADDPFAAKFFKGAYGEAYRPVAIPYRFATGLLSVLIGVVAIHAYKTRRLLWIVLTVVAVVLMTLTLQRTPAVSGLLLAAGAVLMATRRRKWFFALLLLTYVGGTLVYSGLATFGILPDSTITSSNNGFFATIGATAPDIPDALGFLHRWQSAGEPLTGGRTFYGGLVPGNYAWNPSLWSITLGNENIDVSSISSGGLRLPAPLWGATALGTVGAVLVPMMSGVLAGAVSKVAARSIPRTNMVDTVWALQIYVLALALLGNFYILSYLDVTRAIVVVWILGLIVKPRAPGPSLRPRRTLVE